MKFFTSSDLISKYGAISFLAGSSDGYPLVGISGDPLQTPDGTLLIYEFNEYTKIFVKITDTNITATFRQGYQSQKLREVILPTMNGSKIYRAEGNDTVDVSFLILPGISQAVLLSEHLRNNMLTQLQFFNGEGLEHFELVKDFGGEIKVYKIKY